MEVVCGRLVPCIERITSIKARLSGIELKKSSKLNEKRTESEENAVERVCDRQSTNAKKEDIISMSSLSASPELSRLHGACADHKLRKRIKDF